MQTAWLVPSVHTPAWVKGSEFPSPTRGTRPETREAGEPAARPGPTQPALAGSTRTGCCLRVAFQSRRQCPRGRPHVTQQAQCSESEHGARVRPDPQLPSPAAQQPPRVSQK